MKCKTAGLTVCFFLVVYGFLFAGPSWEDHSMESIIGIGLGQSYNEEYGRPLILLIEYNPWSIVIGADVPTFVLYENGQIIYRQIIERESKLYQVIFPKEELGEIIGSFEIPNSIYYIPNEIVSTVGEDQPTTY